MSLLDFSKGDGSGRPPREFQQNALQWLQTNWKSSQVFAIVAPTSAGKSYLSRTIQIATNAAIITASNVLVEQYRREYKLNAFYGQEHYNSHGAYEECKLRACFPDDHTVYNPISFQIAKRQSQFIMPNVIIIDEAHSLIGLLQELCSQVFVINKHERYKQNLDTAQNAVKFITELLVEVNVKLTQLADSKSKKKRELERKAAKYQDLITALQEDSQNFALWIEDKHTFKGSKHYLHIKPTHIPVSFLKKYFKGAKVIMMSATLLPEDIRELASGREYKLFEVDSPIDPKRRAIYIDPTEEVLSYPVPYCELARKIDVVLTNIPLRPAIIHMSYNNIMQVAPLLKTPVLTHTKDTKQEVLDKWLNEGGVLLAAGMSEGLDLKNDLCRLNIVTQLQFPSLADEFVKKRLALSNGRFWYSLQALKHLIQSLGRGVRSESDYAINIVLDGRVSRLISDLKDEVPKFFREAIVWQTVPYSKMVDNIKNFL